ncbi:MAG TPA: hypothetical protein VHL52_10135 [Acidimicrobiia bacterium]|nr:hypothetical protein [Acidimicrobiia bacterium]
MTTISTQIPARRWTAEPKLTVAGLAVGAVLGQVGGALGVGTAQTVLFAVSSIGLAVGAIMLAFRHLRRGETLVAAGFIILAVAETMIWTGGGPEQGGESAFAGATLFYVPALLMVSLPTAFPAWVRALGAAAAIPFGIHAALFLLGAEPTSQGAQAIAGYILLTLAVVGWIVSVVRSPHQ